jgi:prevent-host-death family protein
VKTYNIHEAKTNLSRLIEKALEGEPFIIAKAGRPMVKVMPYVEKAPSRFGFLKGQFEVPDDIDTPFKEDIEKMFYGESPPQIKKDAE